MHIGVLILTHDEFAAQLLNRMLSPDIEPALPIRAMAIHAEMSATVLSFHLGLRVNELDQGVGVLILCDHVCEPLQNAVNEQSLRTPIALISGINHAMVYAVLEDPTRDLHTAAQAAVQAAKMAIKQHSIKLPD